MSHSSTIDHAIRSRIRIKASIFEIIRDSTKSVNQPEKQDLLLGYVGFDEANAKSVKVLRDLCSKEIIENVVIVYNDFGFSLIDVSFTKNNANHPSESPNMYA